MKNFKALARLKRRIGVNGPGITIAVVAMLVALTGVAFAAGGALTGSQKNEVKALIKKEAKKLRGPQGLPGSAGSQGAPGPKGNTGAAGAAGKEGTSVKVTPVSAGDPQNCAELGGALVEKEGSGAPAEVCNGEEGAKGDPGDPWTAGGTLPSNGMLTGSWNASGSGVVSVPLSFSIHLAGNVAEENVYYGAGAEEEEEEISPGVFEKTPFQKHCAKSAVNPEVIAGNSRTLCVYYYLGASTSASLVGIFPISVGNSLAKGASRAGGFLELEITTPGTVYGSYAVSGG